MGDQFQCKADSFAFALSGQCNLALDMIKYCCLHAKVDEI